MGRKAKQITVKEARETWMRLSKRVLSPDFYVDIPVDCLSSASKTAYLADVQAQFKKIWDVSSDVNSDAQPELLKAWMDAYLTTKDRAKVLAALRQRRVSAGSGADDTLVLMSRRASSDFEILATEIGITKKELVELVGDFFLHSKTGRAAFAHLAATAIARPKLPNSFTTSNKRD